jgi:hypothetical protein
MVLAGGLHRELTDEAIDLHIQHGSAIPSWLSGSHLYTINGAASRVGKHDTAWSYRDATWGHVMAGVDADPANAGLIRDWSVAYWEALHPYSAGGAYVKHDDGRGRRSHQSGVSR